MTKPNPNKRPANEARTREAFERRAKIIEQVRYLFARPLGAKMREVQAILDLDENKMNTLMHKSTRDGQLFRVGSHNNSSYFLSADEAKAGWECLRAIAQAARIVAKKRSREAERTKAWELGAPARALREAKQAAAEAARAERERIRQPKPRKVPATPRALLMQALPTPFNPDLTKRSHRPLRAASGPAVIPAHVKVQRLPGIERIYEPKRERIAGGFATAGIGVYPGESSDWATAASERTTA